MEEIRSISLDEMEKVTGGSMKMVVRNGAEVLSSAGRRYSQVGTLTSGTQVNFTGTVSYNSDENITWYYINAPLLGWVKKNDISN